MEVDFVNAHGSRGRVLDDLDEGEAMKYQVEMYVGERWDYCHYSGSIGYASLGECFAVCRLRVKRSVRRD